MKKIVLLLVLVLVLAACITIPEGTKRRILPGSYDELFEAMKMVLIQDYQCIIIDANKEAGFIRAQYRLKGSWLADALTKSQFELALQGGAKDFYQLYEISFVKIPEGTHIQAYICLSEGISPEISAKEYEKFWAKYLENLR